MSFVKLIFVGSTHPITIYDMKDFNKDIQKIAEIYNQPPVYDGLINQQAYAAAPVKIIWVLNDLASLNQKQSFKLPDKITKIATDISNPQVFRRAFCKMSEVSAALLNEVDKEIKTPIPCTFNFKALQHIGVISIKKFSDGRKASHEELLSYYRAAKEVLLNQLHAFNPDVVVFVDSYSYFKNDLQLNELNTFGSCMATAKFNTIYLNVGKPHLNMYRHTYTDDCLKAYQAFKKQITKIKEKTYTKEAFTRDVKLLKTHFEQVQQQSKHIEAEVLKVNNYDVFPKMRSLNKDLQNIAEKLKQLNT